MNCTQILVGCGRFNHSKDNYASDSSVEKWNIEREESEGRRRQK